jgi:hypothetical protein
MAHPGLTGGTARTCAARSTALAGWTPRAAPASPPQPALNMAFSSFQPGGRAPAASSAPRVLLIAQPPLLHALHVELQQRAVSVVACSDGSDWPAFRALVASARPTHVVHALLVSHEATCCTEVGFNS